MEIINLDAYQIIVAEEEIWTVINNVLKQGKTYSKIFVLVDENTHRDCLSILEKNLTEIPLEIIQIQSGELRKNLNTCQHIWNALLHKEADRKALMINLGGGVIGDMGGFCASTFKRGFDFIQMPTTLLAQVDASIGGKLGIDFQVGQMAPIKNCIGLFRNPQAVLVYPPFLETLPPRELRSGYAEVIKHALIASETMWEQLSQVQDLKMINWTSLIPASIRIKQEIVKADPYEKGERKKLNFGHTIGHAIESYALQKGLSLLHGEAIAIGMICEAFLSHKAFVLKTSALQTIANYLIGVYGKKNLDFESFDHLINLMRQDKKNENQQINFTLLRSPGHAVINQTCDSELIRDSLQFYNNL